MTIAWWRRAPPPWSFGRLRAARCADGVSSRPAGVAGTDRLDMGMRAMKEFNERRRTPPSPNDDAVPGFYRVRIGSLVEIGDQMLDAHGRPRPVSLDQVGR